MGIRLDICAESYVSNLAAEAKENQEQSLGLEGNIESPLDNLEQEVLGHWLGGWDWATIGSLMEDKGYKGEDIEKAMQAALHHVEIGSERQRPSTQSHVALIAQSRAELLDVRAVIGA